MTNPVRYNTEADPNSLRIGNLNIGTNSVPKGPTSSTGFFNGINPSINGYTIYLNKASNGPSILTPSSDAQLIIMTNQIAGTSYTTIGQCFTYYAGQPNQVVISNPITPIITDGLVYSSNANILPSYPRSGTTLYDLSGNSNNLTGTGANNIPTFDSTNNSISLDGEAQRFESSTNCGVVGDQTLEAVFLEDAGTAPHTTVICTDVSYQYGIKLMSFKNNNRYGFWLGYGGSNHLGMVEGATLDNDVVYHLLGTYKASTGQVKIYLNGELKMTDTMPETGDVSLNGGNINLGIDYHGLGTGYSMNGNIFSSRIYNKVLTQSEVNQNYFGGSIVTNNLVFNVDAGAPVSYNNGSTTAYSLTGSIDGTLNNGVDFTFGNGGSWIFDGVDDFINFNSDPPIDFIYSDPFSLEVWLNADNTSGFKHLIGKSYADYRLAQNGSGISFRLDANNLTTQTGLIVAGEWTHIVATWEPSTSTARVYQDGVLKVAVTDTSIDWTSTGNRFQIGTSPGEAYYTQGKIPIGRAYSKTLSLDEVVQNYNANINRFN